MDRYRQWPSAPSVDVLGDYREAMHYSPAGFVPRGPNRPPRMGLRRRSGLGAQRGLLDYKVSDLLDAAQQAGRGGGSGRGGRGGRSSGTTPLGSIVVDADPRVLRRIDKLTVEVAEARHATERTAKVVIGAAAAVTAVVVIASFLKG